MNYKRKPIIGIVSKPNVFCDNELYTQQIVYDGLRCAILKNGGLVIGILPTQAINTFCDSDKTDTTELTKYEIEDLYHLISLCDGIVLEGGLSSASYEIEIAKYAIKNDIPLLGICAGFNNIIRARGGNPFLIENTNIHNQEDGKYAHKNIIIKDSLLYSILKEEEVKATFFVIGKYVKKHPELVKRAYEEGHYIANHGYNHDNHKLYKSADSFISEIKNTDIEISKAIGVDNYCSHVFRFPNGFMSPNNKAKKKEAAKLLSDMNYTFIDWNCLNNDSIKKYNSSQLLKNLKKSCKGKGTLVVLMHDTSDVSDTPSVLKDSIDYLKEQGYEFRNFYDL